MSDSPSMKVPRTTSAVRSPENFQHPLTAQEAVLAQLRSEILSGDLPPGSSIRQDAIAQRLGFSRVPVREALKTLEGENLVTYLPRRGYSVTELNYEELKEIYNIRRLLEGEAIRLALVKMTDEDIERVEQASREVEAASASGELNELTIANRRYHFALFEPSGQQQLIRIIRNLWDASDAYRYLYFIGNENRALINREHREILDAVILRDEETAVRLLQHHQDNALAELQTHLPSSRRVTSP